MDSIMDTKEKPTETIEQITEKQNIKCNVCGDPVKYRCPGCDIRTCSLTCVKQHKKDRKCNGVRAKFTYVPREGLTENVICNDYRFLEQTTRAVEEAGRARLKTETKRLPLYVNFLKRKAKELRVDLHLMPHTMSRRKENKSKAYGGNEQLADVCIVWMVEWVFPQAENTATRYQIPSKTSLQDGLKEALEKIEPEKKDLLKQYIDADMDTLSLYMKADYVPANQPKYHRMDPSKTMTENLAGKTLIEYPIIHVVFKNKSEQYTKNVIGEQNASSSGSSESETDSSDGEEEGGKQK